MCIAEVRFVEMVVRDESRGYFRGVFRYKADQGLQGVEKSVEYERGFTTTERMERANALNECVPGLGEDGEI